MNFENPEMFIPRPALAHTAYSMRKLRIGERLMCLGKIIDNGEKPLILAGSIISLLLSSLMIIVTVETLDNDKQQPPFLIFLEQHFIVPLCGIWVIGSLCVVLSAAKHLYEVITEEDKQGQPENREENPIL